MAKRNAKLITVSLACCVEILLYIYISSQRRFQNNRGQHNTTIRGISDPNISSTKSSNPCNVALGAAPKLDHQCPSHLWKRRC